MTQRNPFFVKFLDSRTNELGHVRGSGGNGNLTRHGDQMIDEATGIVLTMPNQPDESTGTTYSELTPPHGHVTMKYPSDNDEVVHG
jgi:hypothetical protein